MKTRFKLNASICLLLFLQSNFAMAETINKKAMQKSKQHSNFSLQKGLTAKDYQSNVIIVKIDPSKKAECKSNGIYVNSLQSTFNSLGVQQQRLLFPNATVGSGKMANGRMAPDLSTIYELHYSANVGIEEAINRILLSEEVVYAEPSYVYTLDHIPNDPDTAVVGTSPARNYYQKIIMAYQAWDISKGDTNTVIGIVDSGGDLDHPDLAANVKYNYNDPIDGIDNDNDGYKDNFKGWDLVGPDPANMLQDGDPNVQSGGNDHGVHVGGDASAVSNNGVGISGIGYKCKLLFVKCAPDVNTTSIYNGYEGIIYAADHGASIINCSWGGSGGGAFGQDAIDYAVSKGALVVAAAGNNGLDMLHFPSSYEGAFSVASSTSADKMSGFSNYNYTVDIAAPGSAIYSTVYNNAYNTYDGTSMASPITAGAAAIVKSHFPTYSGLQVGELLRVTADDIYSKVGIKYRDKIGRGRLNLYKALTVSTPSVRAKNRVLFDNSTGSFLPGDTITLSMDFINYLQATSNLVATLSTTSALITMVNATATVGALGTMQTSAPATFKFVLKPTAIENAPINFKISYADGTYIDAESFTVILNVSTFTIAVNQIQSTATGNGRVGYRSAAAKDGIGMVYRGASMLYEAAFMVAQDSVKVSDNARNETSGTANEDFAVTQRISLVSAPGIDFYSKGEFNDAAAPFSQNISIKHRELAWSQAPDDKYFIVEYKIKNNDTAAITGLYAGMLLDLDVVAPTTNFSQWDPINKLAIVKTAIATDPMAGVKLLSSTAPVNYYGQSWNIPGDPQETDAGFSRKEKYLTLSSGIVNDSLGFGGAGYDIQFTIGAGPYTINPNEEAVVAFAFIGGDSLLDMQASAQAAQNKYNTVVLNLAVNQQKNAALDFKLSPNPTQSKVAISFELQNAISGKIIIRDQLGRVVKTVATGSWEKGANKFETSIQDLKAGIYFISLEDGNQKQTQKLLVY